MDDDKQPGNELGAGERVPASVQHYSVQFRNTGDPMRSLTLFQKPPAGLPDALSTAWRQIPAYDAPPPVVVIPDLRFSVDTVRFGPVVAPLRPMMPGEAGAAFAWTLSPLPSASTEAVEPDAQD